MGQPTLTWTAECYRLRQAQEQAKRELPKEWLPHIDREARHACPEWARVAGHPLAQERVYRSWLERFGGAAAADLTDAEIKSRAAAYAEEARVLEVGRLSAAGAWHEFARLVEFCRTREVEPPPVKLLLIGMTARVRCPYWWRRALRKMVARKSERGAMALGLVSASRRQPYASNRAVQRRLDQNDRNAKAAESILFENDAGYRRTLAELAKVSVSNKAIRRGELMTRIRGCESEAVRCKHPGAMLTLTVPSRFHSTLRNGKRNPKHDGSDPAHAQQWLRTMWARARAKLARMKIKMYGFRVAEPHHDGCTHWHALLWFEDDHALASAVEVIRSYWLSEEGCEPGAHEHRVNVQRMLAGGASGYIAKYVSKNIDDYGIASHEDDYTEDAIETDLLGDKVVKPSTRVEAWAAHWGIRQFQAIGQPPVGVWRELRRVTEQQARAAGVGGLVHSAWIAVQRRGQVLADWGKYVAAQGGVMRGRMCRLIVRHEARECEGLYGCALRRIPVGVALNSRCASTVWSERRLWRRVTRTAEAVSSPDFAALRAAPWTRVNNCTGSLSEDGKHRLKSVRADSSLVAGGRDEPCLIRAAILLQDGGTIMRGADEKNP